MPALLRWVWRGAIVAAVISSSYTAQSHAGASPMRRLMQQGNDGAAPALEGPPVQMSARVEAAAAAPAAIPAAQPEADPRGASTVTPATPDPSAADADEDQEQEEEGEAEATDEEVNDEEEPTTQPQSSQAADAASPTPKLPPAPIADAAPQPPRAAQRRAKLNSAAPLRASAASSQHLDDDPTAAPEASLTRAVQPAEASNPSRPIPMAASIAAPGGSERSSNSESSQQQQQRISAPFEPAPRAADSAEAEQARKRRVKRAAAAKAAAAAAASEEDASRDELPAAKPELTRQNALASRKRPRSSDVNTQSTEPPLEQPLEQRSVSSRPPRRQSNQRVDEEPQSEFRAREQQQQQRPKTKKRPASQRASSSANSPRAATAAAVPSEAKLPDDVVGPEDREDVEAGEPNGTEAAGGDAAKRPAEHAAAGPSVYDALADQQPEQGSALGAAKHGSEPDDSEDAQTDAALSEPSPIDEPPAAAPTPKSPAARGRNQAAKRISERLKAPTKSTSQRKRPTPPAAAAPAASPSFEELQQQQSAPSEPEPTPSKPMDPALAFQAARDRAAELADLQGAHTPLPPKRPLPPPFRETDAAAGLDATAVEPVTKSNGGGSVTDSLSTPSSLAAASADTPPASTDSALAPNPAGSVPSAAELDTPTPAVSPSKQPPLTIETALAEPPLVLHELKLQDASNLTNAYLSRVNPATEPPSRPPPRDAEEQPVPATPVPVPSPAADATPMSSDMPVPTPPIADATPNTEVRQSMLDTKTDDATPALAAPAASPAPATPVREPPVAAPVAEEPTPAPAPVVPVAAPAPAANPIVDSADSLVAPAPAASPSLVDPTAFPEPEWRTVDRSPSGSSSTGFVLLFAFVSFCVFLCIKLKRMIGGEESGAEHEAETGGLLSPSSSGVQLSSSPRSRPPIKPGQVVLDSLTDEEDPEMGFALRHNGGGGGGGSSQGNGGSGSSSQSAESTAPAPSIRGMSLKGGPRQAARPTSQKKGKLGLGVKQLDNESD